MKPGTMITLGRIVAPHGVRGDLRIRPDIERPEILKQCRALFIGKRLYTVIMAKPHKNIYILHLKGVEDRNTAETLINLPVTMDEKDLPRLPDGEYYYFQLLGLSVIAEGRNIGEIKEIIKTGANDVYVVAVPKGKEICLPAIPSCILSIDIERKEMKVALPEWE